MSGINQKQATLIVLEGGHHLLGEAFWKILAVLVMIFLTDRFLASAQTPNIPLPTLTSARAAHSLSTAEAARGYPVRLKVVVTYYDRFIDPRRANLFVADSSGAIFVELSNVPDFDLRAGDVLTISGVSASGDFAPIVAHASAEKIAVTDLPSKAPRVDMMTLLTGKEDGQWVEVEGVVRAVRRSASGLNVFLDLALKDGKLIATTVTEGQVDYSRLIDATVLIRGNSSPRFNHWGQMTGSDIVFPNIRSVSIERPAAASPFEIPVEKIGDLLRYKSTEDLPHRSHVQGRVILHWPGRLLCIQDNSQGLCAEAGESTPLHVGDNVDVVGFPVIGDFGPSMSGASYHKSIGDGETEALVITPSQVLQAAPQARLVTLEGRVIGLDQAAEDPTAVLAVDDLIYTAVLDKHGSTNSFQALQIGSFLKVTGVCIPQSDGTGRTTGSGFPIVNGFHILLRTTKDVYIVKQPSWWNCGALPPHSGRSGFGNACNLFTTGYPGKEGKQTNRYDTRK